MKQSELLTGLRKRWQRYLTELKTFNWSDLNDPSSIGVWPGPVKLILCVVIFAIVVVGGYWFHIRDLQAQLAQITGEESGLRADLESKAVLAANLEAYRTQMAEMEATFGDLLRQLPGKTEVPGLIEDITFTGLGSGLNFTTIALANEVVQEFYIELPINVVVTGNYHDFGTFVSGVASLSRIVTLHDFAVAVVGDNRSNLNMTITAKTYRYKTEEEQAADTAAAQPAN
jgi:type IV pilus assembly protein PilO